MTDKEAVMTSVDMFTAGVDLVSALGQFSVGLRQYNV